MSEVYLCGDPDCRSKLLVLQGPQKEPHRAALPRCVCGSVLEVRGSVEVTPELRSSSETFDQDPNEVRE
jgi:hypothetical protein